MHNKNFKITTKLIEIVGTTKNEKRKKQNVKNSITTNQSERMKKKKSKEKMKIKMVAMNSKATIITINEND